MRSFFFCWWIFWELLWLFGDWRKFWKIIKKIQSRAEIRCFEKLIEILSLGLEKTRLSFPTKKLHLSNRSLACKLVIEMEISFILSSILFFVQTNFLEIKKSNLLIPFSFYCLYQSENLIYFFLIFLDI
jgi:hypothetical protein